MTDCDKVTFDDDNALDEEYLAFVARLREDTASALRAAKGDEAAEKRVLIRYWKYGPQTNLSPATLIDFLAVDTPSILDMAGYSDEEGNLIMQRFDSLSETEIAAADARAK